MRTVILRFVIFGLLVALAIAVVVRPPIAAWLSGYCPLQSVTAEQLDQLPQTQGSGTTQFFDERNRIEVEVPEDMTAGAFLELYQLHSFDHVRREIAAQLGIDELSDSVQLAKGQSFAVTLTPPEESMP